MPNKNIYMGPFSTAKLPAQGKINEDWEILLDTYATAYDSVNNIMLTRTPGAFDPTAEREILGRFAVLKILAKKYKPSKIPVINKLEKLALDNFRGKISDKQYLRLLREITRKEGLNQELIMLAERNIDAVERMQAPFKKINNYQKHVSPVQDLFRPQGPNRTRNEPVPKALRQNHKTQNPFAMFFPTNEKPPKNPFQSGALNGLFQQPKRKPQARKQPQTRRQPPQNNMFEGGVLAPLFNNKRGRK